MHTAEKNLEVVRGLIDQANAATGNTDADLTSAVGSLIGGFGQGGSSDNNLADEIITRTITEITSELNKIGSYAFYDCKNLTRAIFPNVITIGGYAFSDCSALSEVYLPNIGDLVNSLGGRAFRNCTSLKSISLPKYYRITSASPYIFNNCTSLENIDLPRLDSIGATRTFSGCSSLTNIKLPSLKGIGATLIFENCTNLIALILPYESAVVTLNNTNNFTGTPIESGMGYIYVPQALIEAYKVATNWVTFADQFRAIEDYPEICGGDE